jgi:hypothetical protein
MTDLESISTDDYGTYQVSEASSQYPPSAIPQPVPALAPPAEKAPNPRSRCGRKAFGFYTGESEVIQHIMELRAQGLGFDRVATKLNEESVRSRSGKRWHGRVVNRIVKAELAKH